MEEELKGKHSQFLHERSNFLDMVLFVIILGIGVNLIAGGILLVTGVNGWAITSAGISICAIALVVLFVRLLKRRKSYRKIEAFFVYDSKKNNLIPIPRYGFVTNLDMYLSPSFKENRALKVIWDKEPLKNSWEGSQIENKVQNRNEKVREPKSFDIIRETIEYLLLSNLTVHLTDYFAGDRFMKNNLIEFDRGDIPELLLKNRIFELISRPPENRAAFVESTFGEKGKGEVVGIYGKSAVYEKFDLVLPRQSRISKPSTNSILISTKEFDLTMSINFSGMSMNMPHRFEELYLGVVKTDNTISYSVDIEVEVSFKFSSIMPRRGREYHRWIDSFLDSLEQEISAQRFFEAIGWNTAVTVIESLREAKEVGIKSPQVE